MESSSSSNQQHPQLYVDRRLHRIANELASEPRIAQAPPSSSAIHAVGGGGSGAMAAGSPQIASKSSDNKGKQRQMDVPDSPHGILHSTSAAGPPKLLVAKPERLGALGIPIVSDEEDQANLTSGEEPSSVEPQSDMSSLEANAPADQFGPSTKSVTTSSAASASASASRHGASTVISDEGFRGIVDDLTRENQTLRRKLNQYEAKIPSRLREERLFEVRFFEGLPKAKRKELEAFLTSYVQSINTGDTPPPLPQLPGVEALTDSGTTSSLGVSLGSYRSSQREAIQAEQATRDQRSWSEGAATSGSRHASDVLSGSASGASADNASSKRSKSRRQHEHIIGSTSPRSARTQRVPGSPMDRTRLAHPPAILPRSMSPLTAERDMLSGPSFFGVEPLSLTGTGAGMRMTHPNKRKKRVASSQPEYPDPPIRTSPPRSGRTSGEGSGSDQDQRDPEELAHLVVSMLERLFEESFPVLSEDGKRVLQQHTNSLIDTEPSPLPPQSSSNPAYLHALRTSSDTVDNGGWIYLNLLLTMAAVHRLNVSISFVRGAIRSMSRKIELNPEGNKARWIGPTVRVENRRQVEGERTLTENVERSNRQRAHQQEAEDAAAFDSRSQGPGSSENDTRQPLSAFDTSTKPSTEGTSIDPSRTTNSNSVSKNGTGTVSASATGSNTQSRSITMSGSQSHSHSHSGLSGSKDTGTSSGKSNRSRESNLQGSSLKNSVSANGSRSAGDADDQMAHAAALPATAADGQTHARKSPSPDQLQTLTDSRLYVPLFPQSRQSDSDSDEEANEREGKRRRVARGGLTFFKTDSFLSDLAGDAVVRERLFCEQQEARAKAVDIDQVMTSVSPRTTKSLTSPVLAASGSKRDRSVSPVSPRPSVRPLFSRNRSFSVAESVPGEEVVTELVMISDDDARAHDPEELRIVPLQLSGMATNVVGDDHFTLVVAAKHPTFRHQDRPFSSRKRPTEPLQSLSKTSSSSGKSLHTIVESNTLLHLPAQLVRVPRVRLALDESSDDESGSDKDTLEARLTAEQRRQRKRQSIGVGPDYNLSLSLPLHSWAPTTRRSDSEDSSMTDL